MLVIEFHYTDGDVGAHEAGDLERQLWTHFSSRGPGRPHHIIVREASSSIEDDICDECGQGPKGHVDETHLTSCSLHPTATEDSAEPGPAPVAQAKDRATTALLGTVCDTQAAAALGVLEAATGSGITWGDERDYAYDHGRTLGQRLLGVA